MKSKLFPLFRVSSITLAAAFSLGTAYASPISWDGSDSTVWALGTNWTGDAAPANDLTSDIALFNLVSYTTPVFAPNAGTTSVNGIQIGDGATTTGALTLSGTALTVGTSGIDMKANAGATTISSPVTLGAVQTWQNASASLLTLSGAVTGGSNLLTIDGAGNTTVSGAIGGTGGLVKLGNGTLSLSKATAGSYSYTGGTTVNAGTLQFGYVNSNGVSNIGSGTLTINAGATAIGSPNANTNNPIGYQGSIVQLIAINGGTYTSKSPSGHWTDSISMTGGTLNGTGHIDFESYAGYSSTVTINASATPSTISVATFKLGTAVTFNVLSGGTGVISSITSGSGTHSLSKTGDGILNLNAANTYTGATNVNNGSLLLNAGSLHTSSAVTVGTASTTTSIFGGKGGAGAVSVYAGNTIQGGYANAGSLALTSLSFSGSSALNLMPVSGTTASVAVSGTLTTNGTETLNITSSSPLGVGSYRLLSWGTIAGSGTGAFVLGSTPTTPGTVRPRSYALDTTPANYIGLNVTGDAPVWTGNNNGDWDTTTANNWVLASNGSTATTYYAADAVQFNNTTGTRNITISGADMTPASVAFNNGTGNDYTLGGSNGIAGSASLTKSGAGALTINNANSYIGSTTINAGTLTINNNSSTSSITINGGTLEVGGSGSLGSGSYAGAITNNAAFVYSSSSNQALSGAISGSGTLTKSGGSTLTLSGTHSYTGGTTVNGGVLTVSSAGGSVGSIRGALTINNGATVNASTSWGFGYAGDSTTVTAIAINGGTLNFTGALDAGGISASSITMTGGTISGTGFDWYNGSPVTRTLTTLASSTTATISSGINMRLGSGGALKFDVADGAADTDLLVSGVLRYNAGQPGAAVIKDGAGRAEFSGTNTYTGTTTITAGTLVAANTSGSATGTGAVTVKPAAILAGTGSIGGSTTVESGGVVAPGVSGIGTLTVASAAMSGTYQCDLGSSTSDLLAVTGILTVGGTTSITFSGTPTANSYTIASYGTLSGTLPAITPPSGYSLVDDSANKQIKLVKVAAGYDSWMAAWVTAGFTGDIAVGADPDADGLKNLLEFVLNGNPGSSDTTILPVQQVTATDLVFTFTRRVDSATGTTQVFEYGSNLAGWTPVNITGTPGTEVLIGAPTGTALNQVQTVTITIPRSAEGNGKLFGRLMVTQP